MLKITCISDTHRYHRKMTLEGTGLLIYAGDCMGAGFDKEELVDFLDWFELQPAMHKVMIAGNHDRWIENNPEEFRELMAENYPNIIYLEDEWVIIEGFKIYGTPHSKIFYNWAFNRTEEQLHQLFDKIPNDTDILISHAPQRFVLDELIDGQNVGEMTLRLKLKQLTKLKLHVFGHIHNAFGMIKPHGKHISINACQVDEAYDLKNFPVTINI